MNSAKDWYEELEDYYHLIKEGDMPEQKDAQTLFEVK